MAEATHSGSFTLSDLVDLALCSPEVGAVNFNILRILLHEILKKLDIVGQTANLNDLEAHQINNFQSYIQGSGTASPMPGVLRYSPGTQRADSKTPRTSREEERTSVASSARSSSAPKVFTKENIHSIGVVYARQSMPEVESGIPVEDKPAVSHMSPGSSNDSMETKVARLERHLEALYALPSNSKLLGNEPEKDKNMSVNDMWQIIQLNNRVAAAEAAIQKMASLIEDLAKQIKVLKVDNSGLRKDGQKLSKTSSELAIQMDPCIEKCEHTYNSVQTLKTDLDKIKAHLLLEIEKLSKAAGVDVTRIPTFMEPRKPSIESDGSERKVTLVKQSEGGHRDSGQSQSGETIGTKIGGQDAPSELGKKKDNEKQSGQRKSVEGQPVEQKSAEKQPSNQQGQRSSGEQLAPDGQPIKRNSQIEDEELAQQYAARDKRMPSYGFIQQYEPNGKPIPGQGFVQQYGTDGKPIPGQGFVQQYGPNVQHIPGQAFVQQYGPDGKPIPGQRFVQQYGPDGQPIPEQYNVQQVGPDGRPIPGQRTSQEVRIFGQSIPDQANLQLVGPLGQPIPGQGNVQQVQSNVKQGQVFVQQYGSDGQPIPGQGYFLQVGTDGQPAPEQTKPIAGKGFIQQYDSYGQPIPPEGFVQQFDTNGKPIPYQPDMVYGPDGQPILEDGTYYEHFESYEQQEENYKQSGSLEDISDEGIQGSRTTSLIDVETRGSKKDSKGSQDGINSAHADHPEGGNLTEAHPDMRHQGISHIPVDVTTQALDEIMDPFGEYRTPKVYADGTVSIGKMDQKFEPEECEAQMQVVQKELQAQYIKLQEMQRMMSQEIQDKMELVYQKLIKEIAAQHSTTSPYMAVGLNTDKCLGPGVCSGFGLPAGTTVCQFPQEPVKASVCEKGGKVCPGRDVCPGKEVCPTCKDDILHSLRFPGDKTRLAALDLPKPGLSSSKENLLRQLTSMTLLPRDLEDLREKIKERGNVPDVFDEMDVLEKLQTLWEAVNVIKSNEENMAVRLVQQDAVLKKIPENAIEKLGRMSASSFDKMNDESGLKSLKSMKDFGTEDVQLIFNNLSSLVLENGAMKERLQKINEALMDFEQNMVTKPMLMNVMSDKADKGVMNTKVSYDEFGAGMDELQSRLGNLLQEVYRKNELWKEITDNMREDLGEKLDKVELGPLRAYFKNHLGKLEEKVSYLTKIMDEPDPAGTRKKLLKDYNCLSCDRHTNISGHTNAPLLPVLGPILAGHSTASQRAFELYRMRPPTSRYDAEGRNFCQLEMQTRADGDNNLSSQMPLNDSDVLHLVNRYVGGSHTAISMHDRIAALNKRTSVGVSKIKPSTPIERPKTTAPVNYFFEE